MLKKNKLKESIYSAIEYSAINRDNSPNMFTDEICEILTSSYGGNVWYFHNGFFCVDVAPSDYEEYMGFIEYLTGCSYCYTMRDDGLTFKMSLSTLGKKL